MKYLDMLKSEIAHLQEPSKGSKATYDPFESDVGRHISQKNTENPPKFFLPEDCPLRGGPVPSGCRFQSKFFARMVREGVLPDSDGGCPLFNVCGLRSDRKRAS